MYHHRDPKGTGSHYKISDAKSKDERIGHLDKIQMENSEDKRRCNKRKDISEAAKTLHYYSAEDYLFNKSGENGKRKTINYIGRKGFRDFVFRHCDSDSENFKDYLESACRIGSNHSDPKAYQNAAESEVRFCLAEREGNFERDFYAKRIDKKRRQSYARPENIDPATAL